MQFVTFSHSVKMSSSSVSSFASRLFTKLGQSQRVFVVQCSNICSRVRTIFEMFEHFVPPFCPKHSFIWQCSNSRFRVRTIFGLFEHFWMVFEHSFSCSNTFGRCSNTFSGFATRGLRSESAHCDFVWFELLLDLCRQCSGGCCRRRTAILGILPFRLVCMQDGGGEQTRELVFVS